MITWKIGTPVVCVKNFRGVNARLVPLDYIPPMKDKVYTFGGVKAYDEIWSCWYIYLEEFGKLKTFNHTHFRPVKEVMDEWTEELCKELEQEVEVEILIKK